MIKKNNKYNYIQGKQLTDPGSGTRVYEISNYRLPSVTTILGATKNTEFLRKIMISLINYSKSNGILMQVTNNLN